MSRPCVFEHENCIIVEFTPDGKDGRSVVAKGEWDSETEYIFDDLVSYQGSSYIALRTVPAGTLPTDTEYWMVNASGNTVPWGNIVGTLGDQTDLKDALDLKADASTVYTKTEADALLALKADASAVYTKAESDTLLSAKADASTVYTKTETDSLLSAKADSSDVYTKTQTDSLLSAKADSSDVYSKSQTDTLLSAKADTSSLGDLATLDTVDYDTQVTNKPTLGALASKDTVDYETDITNLPTLGTMSAVNDAPSDDKPYARKNGDWAEVTGGGGGDAVWGGISGTLSDQTDLANALQNKADVIVASVSGSVASFPDGMASPVVGLTVGVEPVQDLHGQSSPYPPGGGKNLLPPMSVASKTDSGVTCTRNDDGSISFSGQASQSVAITFIEFQLPSGTYLYSNVGSTCTSVGASTTAYIRDLDNASTLASINYGTEQTGVSFTLSETTNVRHYMVVSNGATLSGKLFGMVRLSSVSDSTFAPYSNICPISGHSSATVTRTGMNLLNPSDIEQIQVTSDGTMRYGTKIDIIGTFIVHAERFRTGRYVYAKVISSNGVYGSANYITSDSVKYAPIINVPDGSNLYVYTNGQTAEATTSVLNDLGVMVEYGTTVSPFVAYQGTSVTIPFGSTVYGATLDVVGRRLTVTYAMQNLGDLTWTYYTQVDHPFFYSTALNPAYKYVSSNPNILCSNYAFASISGSNTNQGINVLDSSIVRIRDNQYSDATTFTSAMNGVQLVYELATPTVIENLTDAQISTLLGQNNIWADTGDCNVQYRADTKLYIDGKVNETTLATRQMLTSVETEMKATKNYTSGQTVIVGDSFYKLTSNVANGGTFTPGTNCTKVTMAEWILSIV